MTTFDMSGIGQILHRNRDKSAAARIRNSLAASQSRSEPAVSAIPGKTSGSAPKLDSFQISRQISELLSPACGMSEEEKKDYLAKIMAKLKSGKKLTPEEMRFLQSEDPILYQQAARVQAMRESLESRMAHADSREEAAEIYADAIAHISKDDPMKEYLVAAYDDVLKEKEKELHGSRTDDSAAETHGQQQH